MSDGARLIVSAGWSIGTVGFAVSLKAWRAALSMRLDVFFEAILIQARSRR